MQSQSSYSIKENDDTKILLTHIRKMPHTADDKTASTEDTIDREKSDVYSRKIWVLQ